MKHRIFAFLLVCALTFGLVTSAAAQTYSFQLPKEVVHVYWNGDGTLAIDYQFTFANDPSADPIEFVDVGLPNSNYAFNSITADVDGTPVSVTKDYQGDGGSGVAVALGSRAIQPGQTGTVHVYIGHIERMYFPDDNDENYASGEFSPTWFRSQYVSGVTDLTVIFHLPPGVQADEPRYHPARGSWPGLTEPTAGFDQQDRVTYTWNSPYANGYTQYTFGASFPKQYIPEDAIVRVSLLEQIIGGIAALIGGLSSIMPFCCFGLFFFGIPIIGAISERKRKMQYLPPKISIEGHGIKRGLTAVEAAILMGQPLDRVMTMILFGAIKKNAVQVATRDPLELEFATPMPTELHEYEKDFISAFRHTDTRQRRRALQEMTVKLVKSVTEKMKGFSRKETIEYYQAVNNKAWQQIAAANTPEVKGQMYEEAMEWTMLDKDYDERARRTFTGPIFVPTWWGRYDPVYRSGPTFGSAPVSMGGGTGGGRMSLPGADLAASIMNGTQSFAQRVLGNVNDFTSGVTNVTNPPPPPSKGGGGRSGGGCACACACAGCACACAGGGR